MNPGEGWNDLTTLSNSSPQRLLLSMSDRARRANAPHTKTARAASSFSDRWWSNRSRSGISVGPAGSEESEPRRCHCSRPLVLHATDVTHCSNAPAQLLCKPAGGLAFAAELQGQFLLPWGIAPAASSQTTTRRPAVSRLDLDHRG